MFSSFFLNPSLSLVPCASCPNICVTQSRHNLMRSNNLFTDTCCSMNDCQLSFEAGLCTVLEDGNAESPTMHAVVCYISESCAHGLARPRHPPRHGKLGMALRGAIMPHCSAAATPYCRRHDITGCREQRSGARGHRPASLPCCRTTCAANGPTAAAAAATSSSCCLSQEVGHRVAGRHPAPPWYLAAPACPAAERSRIVRRVTGSRGRRCGAPS